MLSTAKADGRKTGIFAMSELAHATKADFYNAVFSACWILIVR